MSRAGRAHAIESIPCHGHRHELHQRPDAGQTIRIDTNQLVITQIVSQTALYVGDPYAAPRRARGSPCGRGSMWDFSEPGTRLGLPPSACSAAAVSSATALTLTAPFGGASTNLTGYRLEENPSTPPRAAPVVLARTCQPRLLHVLRCGGTPMA